MPRAGKNPLAWKRPHVWLLVSITILWRPPLLYPAAPEFLTPVSSFSVSGPVTSLAISADEALVAVATQRNNDTWVEIRDRQTTQVLTKLVSRNNSVQRMEFGIHKQMLALSGADRLELWDLENLESTPESRIPENQRIWRSQTNGPAMMRFSSKNAKLRWIDDNLLQQIPLNPPFIESRVWTGEGESPRLLSFRFDPEEKVLALAEQGIARIRLVQPWLNTVLPSLDYHLFPVTDLYFSSSSNLISLDREGVLAWGDIETRIKTASAAQTARNTGSLTRRLYPIFRDQFVLYTSDNPSNAQVVDKTGKIHHILQLSSGAAATVSATGTYVITTDPQGRVHIHQTARHQLPRDYIEQLINAGAGDTARRYQNHLAQPIPAQGNQGRIDSRTPLKILEDNLNIAEETEQWLETERLVNEILILEPKNVHALSSLNRLNERNDRAVLEKGMNLLELRNPDEAVNLLKQIPASSSFHSDARRLIGRADQMAQTNLTLKNAQQQMRLGNWEGAEILLKQILENEPENDAVKKLLEEAGWAKFWNNVGNAALVLLALLFATGLMWMLYSKRIRIGSWFADQTEEPITLKSFPNINLRKKSPPQPSAEEKRYRETLQKTEEFLTLAKQRDAAGEYTARLLDFEAEMKVISSKGKHADADFKHLTSQLLVLMQTLRGLKFHARERKRRSRAQNKSSAKETHNSQNFYELLGVPRAASMDEIRTAYHRKIKEYHPDRHQNTEFEWIREQATTMSRNLREAYETLVDQHARQRYNETLDKEHTP